MRTNDFELRTLSGSPVPWLASGYIPAPNHASPLRPSLPSPTISAWVIPECSVQWSSSVWLQACSGKYTNGSLPMLYFVNSRVPNAPRSGKASTLPIDNEPSW